MSKDFIFYSNYCEHSKKLLDILNNNNMLNNFELCCVDSNDIQIPDFIECVPTLYITAQKRVLSNDGLFHYINIESNKSQQQQPHQQQQPQQQQQQQQFQQQQQPQQQFQQQQPQQQPQQQQQQQPQQQQNPNGNSNDEISGYFSKEMSSTFSDDYSFLEGNTQIEHSYTFLDSKDSKDNNNNNNTSVNTNMQQSQLQPQISNDNNSGNSNKSGLMDKAYEQMMKDRGSDMPHSNIGLRV
jgi:hypothetical protein